MYATVLTNVLILSATHFHVAPPLLTLYLPMMLAATCLARLVMWWSKRDHSFTDTEASSMLRSMVLMATILGFGFSGWAISLYPYGDGFQQAQIAFFIAVTTIGCMFCLIHLRPAAVAAAASIIVPFSIYILLSGNGVLIAMTINLIVVVVALMSILFRYNSNFAELVASRAEMAENQAETQRLSDANHRLANRDDLTDLPNRRSFERQLNAMLAQAHLDGREIAVARLDVDSFKAVNEIFGHANGNRVLAEIGLRILSHCSTATFVARTGGDQFGLIIDGPFSDQQVPRWGEQICAAMRQPFVLPGSNLRASVSMGLAISRDDDTPETLYDRADYASTVAKRGYRGAAVLFDERHADEISKVRSMEHALHTADLDAEIYILFQPQFDIAFNRTTGYEVLARWRSPTLGEVSPGEFIPMAERSGMISKITQTVLKKALAVLDELPAPMRLSVNLSAHDIGSATAIEGIAALVGAAGTPCRIDFEITETSIMRDLQQANAALVSLLALGSRIALDDFGTGHSSLTYIQNLPLDRIKVDRSFVAEVTSNPTSRAIIKTTVDLCRNLGITCVFEGIETEEQLEALLGLGGTVMQGYLFGRPMSKTAMLEHCARERLGANEMPRLNLHATS
ncbi:putative bifunctional diguanylate cyclase/phosphodiesterase [Devosia limi]|nr:EAL domain-containing protein [Devosia limi]